MRSMWGKLFLIFDIMVFLVIALILVGNESVITVLKYVPFLNDTVSTESDAEHSIISAQKSLKASYNSEKTLAWEAGYKSVIEKAGTSRVVRKKETISQITPIKTYAPAALSKGNIIYVASDGVMPSPREVFLVAVVGSDGLEWQKRVGFVNESDNRESGC